MVLRWLGHRHVSDVAESDGVIYMLHGKLPLYYMVDEAENSHQAEWNFVKHVQIGIADDVWAAMTAEHMYMSTSCTHMSILALKHAATNPSLLGACSIAVNQATILLNP